MSEITEVKNRIKGVSDTRKITGALYLISSAKVKKAREELEKTAPSNLAEFVLAGVANAT